MRIVVILLMAVLGALLGAAIGGFGMYLLLDYNLLSICHGTPGDNGGAGFCALAVVLYSIIGGGIIGTFALPMLWCIVKEAKGS